MHFFSLIKQIFNVYLFITLLIVGCYEIFVEPKFLNKKGLNQDSKLCRIIGITYIVLDAAIYLFSRVTIL